MKVVERPSAPATSWALLAAVVFAIVGTINAAKFGLGPAAAAGVAAAALVLMPHQLGQRAAGPAWYLAPIAMVGLQGKMVGGCPTCISEPGPTGTAVPQAGSLLLASSLLGILILAAMTVFRLSPRIRWGIAAGVLVSQAVLLLALPAFCVACLLATFVVVGLTTSHVPPRFADTQLFRSATASVALLGVVTATAAALGAYPQTSPLGQGRALIPATELNRLNVPDGATVVISSPGCPACREAAAFLADHRPSWIVRNPCSTMTTVGCWSSESAGFRLPTLLRREGDQYRVLVQGFSVQEWENHP